MNAYSELEQMFRRIGALEQAEGMLHWDHSVVMPPGGAEARAEQLAALGPTFSTQRRPRRPRISGHGAICGKCAGAGGTGRRSTVRWSRR